MDYPEGLTLCLDHENTLRITDVQDLALVTFNRPGHGDPTKWPLAVVAETCTALSVDEAYDSNGEGCGVADLTQLWLDGHGCEDGFML